MKPRFLFLIFALLCCVPLSVHGQKTIDPAFYFGGIFDFATAFNEKGAPLIHTLRRGESPFDNMAATLFCDVVITSRLTVFNQIVLHPTSSTAISNLWRPIVQFAAIKHPHYELFLEMGKLSTTFGSYGPRAYSNHNPLLTTPLTHHYFTSLRAAQLPLDNTDLLKSWGQGNASLFTGFSGGGNPAPRAGLPIIYDGCWDTGVRAFGSLWRLEYSLGLTHGTLSDPKQTGVDNNEGKQVITRVAAVPFVGLVVGTSFARGAYLDASVANALKPLGKKPEDFVQEAFGFDAAYEIGHFKVLGELVLNRWEMPRIVDVQGNPTDLTCTGWYVEGRYAFLPGWYGAVRYDRITFGKIADKAGQAVSWDDDIWRVEGGLGYYFWDGVLCKVIVQDTHRLRLPRITLAGAQLSVSF